MKKHEEVDEFISNLDRDQLKQYDMLKQMGQTFDEIKTAMIYQEDFEFNKNVTPYLTSLQQESREHSVGQSSEETGKAFKQAPWKNHDSYFCPRRFQIYEQSQSTS